MCETKLFYDISIEKIHEIGRDFYHKIYDEKITVKVKGFPIGT